MVSKLVIEDLGVFDISGVYADDCRPDDTFGAAERQRMQAVAINPVTAAALTPMSLSVDVATTRACYALAASPSFGPNRPSSTAVKATKCSPTSTSGRRS